MQGYKRQDRTQDAQEKVDGSAGVRKRRCGRREDTEKGEEEKGGRSYVSIPPPEVGGPRNRLRGQICHPSDGFGACARRVLVSSRLGPFFLSWTNLCGRAARTVSSPPWIYRRVHRRLSPLGRSVGHQSLPDSLVPPCYRVSRDLRCLPMTRVESDEVRRDISLHFLSPIIDNKEGKKRKRERETIKILRRTRRRWFNYDATRRSRPGRILLDSVWNLGVTRRTMTLELSRVEHEKANS